MTPSDFPHTVSVESSMVARVKTAIERYEWCSQNIGVIGTDWTYIVGLDSDVFKFKHQDHAVLFALRWGGK